MEPRIQYAKTTDGVSIAFFAIGKGPPLIVVPPVPYTHLQVEWDDPGYRAWDERLASGTRLVRYDNRGSGLSDHGATDLSLEGLMLDIDAVADRVGFDRFALAGISLGCPVVVTYAARRPQRVSRLVLWCPYGAGADIIADPRQVIRGMHDQDWELFTETVAHAVVAGWSAGDQAHRFAKLMRASVPSGGSPLEYNVRHADLDAEFGLISCPALVIHRRDARFPRVDVAKHVAARIPDAQLVLLEGEAILPFVGDMEAPALAIESFLGIHARTAPPVPAPSGGQPALATVLFTDIEGSTAMTQRLGDARAREVLREHERITREALKAHGGAEVKTMGDGFMASFSSATKALECAIALQRAFEEHNESAEEPIRVRVGINAGEPIAEDDPGGRGDLFGTAVNMAARIAAQAEGGEILASNVVRELVAGKKFPFSDRGETTLRGFEDRVHIYQVSWRG